MPRQRLLQRVSGEGAGAAGAGSSAPARFAGAEICREPRTPGSPSGEQDPSGGLPGAEAPDTDVIDEPVPKRSERLLCRQCGRVMTSREAVIEIDGASDHVFENPHGVVYHVRCFGEAPGAVTLGAPTTEFTWFRGYSWQIALCGECRSHVGWAFVAAKHRFWGLIPGRLVEEAE